MAEIEFKRRGTPLWAVLLALIVIALIVWFVLRKPPGAPTAAAPAPAPTATQPSTPAPAAAPPQTPAERFSAYVDSQPTVPDAATASYVADGLSRLADAMQEKYPASGVQLNLIRAMSDSLRLPGIAPRRQTDMAQAAFFAAGYVISHNDAAGPVTQAASSVQLEQPLPKQLPAVRKVFRAARDAIKGAAAPGAPGGGAAPKR
jgi:hypothetical protein